MRLLLTLILFLVSTSIFGYGVDHICDSAHPNNRLKGPIFQDKNIKDIPWCVEALCFNEKRETTRKRCVSQPGKKTEEVVEYSFTIKDNDSYSEPGRSGYTGRLYDRLFVDKEDSCFDVCQSHTEKKGFRTKKILPREKQECMECILTKEVAPEAVKVKSLNVVIYKGQACFPACREPESVVDGVSVYSEECLSCASKAENLLKSGTPVIKYYFRDFLGLCLEVIKGDNKHVWKVPQKLCDEANPLYSTAFKRGSKFTMRTVFLGEAVSCIEYDLAPGGPYIHREVPNEYCPEIKDVNISDRNSGKETSPGKKSSGQGSGRQSGARTQ